MNFRTEISDVNNCAAIVCFRSFNKELNLRVQEENTFRNQLCSLAQMHGVQFFESQDWMGYDCEKLYIFYFPNNNMAKQFIQAIEVLL